MKPWKSAREIKKSATSTMNWYIKYHWHPLGRTFYELVPILLRRKIPTVFPSFGCVSLFQISWPTAFFLTLTLGISMQLVREWPFDGQATTRDEHSSPTTHKTQRPSPWSSLRVLLIVSQINGSVNLRLYQRKDNSFGYVASHVLFDAATAGFYKSP